MSNREKNLKILKQAMAGKLKAEDLIYDLDNPTFDICLDLYRTGGCNSKLTEQEIQRLKAKGMYFDITLNIT